MVRRSVPVTVLLCIIASGGVVEAAGQERAASGKAGRSAAKCHAVSSGTDDEFSGATLADALRGKIPGVTVTAVSGSAGGAGVLRIRGTNSIQSNTPLLFVDDIRVIALPATGPGGVYAAPLLEFVDVSLIESIEVLRGPAATLRYGQGASAGVIKIYTRRGRPAARGDRPSESGCPAA